MDAKQVRAKEREIMREKFFNELAADLTAHVEVEMGELIRAGMTADDAFIAARTDVTELLTEALLKSGEMLNYQPTVRGAMETSLARFRFVPLEPK